MLNVWLKQDIRVRDADLSVCVVRDAKHFVKLQMTGFTPKVAENPTVGDKVKIVALTSYDETGCLVLSTDFSKITKLVDQDDYSSLDAVASPGKVYELKIFNYFVKVTNFFSFSENQSGVSCTQKFLTLA